MKGSSGKPRQKFSVNNYEQKKTFKKKKNIKNRMKNRMFSHYVSCFIAFAKNLETTLSGRSPGP